MNNKKREASAQFLIVDDDPVFLEIVKTTVDIIAEEEDIYVYYLPCCFKLNDAKEEIMQSSMMFNAMLLDIQMPEMDGISWFQEIQGRVYMPPTIIVSSSVLESDIRRAYRAGVAGYITKTGYFKVLYEKIQAILLFYTKICEPPSN